MHFQYQKKEMENVFKWWCLANITIKLSKFWCAFLFKYQSNWATKQKLDLRSEKLFSSLLRRCVVCSTAHCSRNCESCSPMLHICVQVSLIFFREKSNCFILQREYIHLRNVALSPGTMATSSYCHVNNGFPAYWRSFPSKIMTPKWHLPSEGRQLHNMKDGIQCVFTQIWSMPTLWVGVGSEVLDRLPHVRSYGPGFCLFELFELW